MLNHPHPAYQLADWYAQLNATSLNQLAQYYAEEVYFQDPLQSTTGAEAVQSMFNQLFIRTENTRFIILGEYLKNPQEAMLRREISMILQNRGIAFDGSSFLRFHADKVIYHRNYWDITELVQPLSMAGMLMHLIKKPLQHLHKK